MQISATGVVLKNLVPEDLKKPVRSQLHRLKAWKKLALLHYKKSQQSFLIKQYCDSHSVIKVCLGAGQHVKDGWLNTDYEPFGHPDIVYLNAAERFPFSDEIVDYYYAEHMIEHLHLQSGQSMLSECYRTLKKGGTIRIATPDMMQLAKLLSPEQKSPEVTAYAEWALETFPPPLQTSTARTNCMVFNNFMRDWGHQFVFDEKTLASLLQSAGFKTIRRCPINVSLDPQLASQEMHQHVTGTAANEFETLVLEAIK